AVVEIQTAEDRVRPATQVRHEKRPGSFGRRKRGTQAQRLAKVPPRELEGRLEDGVAGRSYADLCEAALRLRVQQLAQRAELGDQHAPELDRGAPPCARAEEQRQQLRIRERVSAALEQFLAWPLGVRPVPDAHYFRFYRGRAASLRTPMSGPGGGESPRSLAISSSFAPAT